MGDGKGHRTNSKWSKKPLKQQYLSRKKPPEKLDHMVKKTIEQMSVEWNIYKQWLMNGKR